MKEQLRSLKKHASRQRRSSSRTKSSEQPSHGSIQHSKNAQSPSSITVPTTIAVDSAVRDQIIADRRSEAQQIEAIRQAHMSMASSNTTSAPTEEADEMAIDSRHSRQESTAHSPPSRNTRSRTYSAPDQEQAAVPTPSPTTTSQRTSLPSEFPTDVTGSRGASGSTAGP